MADKTGVNPNSPPGASDPSAEGKLSYEKLEELFANEKKETDRMKGALASLQSERDEIRERLDELEAIETKRELSLKEEAERNRLQKGEISLEDQIEDLKRKPEAKPWFSHLENEIKKTTKIASEQGRIDALTELAADFLEEQAEELSEKKDESGEFLYKNMTDEKLYKELKPFFSQFENKNPYMRVKKAFKAWISHQNFLKEKSTLEREKALFASSRENGTRLSRANNLDDAIKSGDKATQREMLGIMHRNK